MPAPASCSVLQASFPWDDASEAAATIYILYARMYPDTSICTTRDERCTRLWVGRALGNTGAPRTRSMHKVVPSHNAIITQLAICFALLFVPLVSPERPPRAYLDGPSASCALSNG